MSTILFPELTESFDKAETIAHATENDDRGTLTITTDSL